MQVRQRDVITITYSVKDDDGRVLDRVFSDAPMTVLMGSGQLLPDVEAAIVGREVGDVVQCRLEPRPEPPDGRGRRGFLKVPRDLLPAGLEPKVGAALVAEGEHGQFTTWIREVRQDVVVLDPNHPLTGLALNVRVELLDVRAPTDAERTAGRAEQAPWPPPGRS